MSHQSTRHGAGTWAQDPISSDRVFDALGDPARRRILELLRSGPIAVGVLADQLPIGRPAVSKHLRVLSDAGLAAHRRVGTRNLYALAPEGLVEAQRWLIRNWDDVLGAFGAYVASAGAEASPARPEPETPRNTSPNRSRRVS